MTKTWSAVGRWLAREARGSSAASLRSPRTGSRRPRDRDRAGRRRSWCRTAGGAGQEPVGVGGVAGLEHLEAVTQLEAHGEHQRAQPAVGELDEVAERPGRPGAARRCGSPRRPPPGSALAHPPRADDGDVVAGVTKGQALLPDPAVQRDGHVLHDRSPPVRRAAVRRRRFTRRPRSSRPARPTTGWGSNRPRRWTGPASGAPSTPGDVGRRRSDHPPPDDPDGLGEDHQVQPDRPVLHVEQVQPPVDREGGLVAAFDLPEPGDTRFDQDPFLQPPLEAPRPPPAARAEARRGSSRRAAR